MIYLSNAWIADSRITNPQATLGDLEVIQRFANILTLLRDEVYKIEGSAVSIFYDFDGPLVAFNRDGCIFVNLRVYKQWCKHSAGFAGVALKCEV